MKAKSKKQKAETILPCPFCGGKGREVPKTINPYRMEVPGVTCINPRCIIGAYHFPKSKWQERPAQGGEHAH